MYLPDDHFLSFGDNDHVIYIYSIAIIFFPVFFLHQDSFRDTNWTNIYNDFVEHRSRRLQREADDQTATNSNDVTYQNEAGGSAYYARRPAHSPDTADWHEFRDNVQKLGHLDNDGIVTLKAKVRSAEYCNPIGSQITGQEGVYCIDMGFG